MTEEIESTIVSLASAHGLPANLVKAICQVESAFDPWAFRYEPGYRYLVGNQLTMSLTERFGQMCSWGLMQLMGGVARELGYGGWFPQLCQPEIGVDYGCIHLKKFYEKHGNWPDAIASYNAGSPRRVGMNYLNQAYVDKVQRAWNAFDTSEQI